jgi:hypothetical protein
VSPSPDTPQTPAKRLLGALLAAACLSTLAACGGDDPAAKAPLGSPENPVQAVQSKDEGATNEGSGTASTPGFKALVDQQADTPVQEDRSNPCALVTKAQASAIMGARLLDPVLAPQGPNCIYRNRSGQSFATLAYQAIDMGQLKRQTRKVREVEVADRRAYCGVNGSPVLYLPVGSGRVLSVNAQCEVAMRFARRAVPHLAG